MQGGETLATAIFGGATRSEVRTAGVPASATLQPFTHLQLDILPPHVNSLADAFEFFIAAEDIEGGCLLGPRRTLPWACLLAQGSQSGRGCSGSAAEACPRRLALLLSSGVSWESLCSARCRQIKGCCNPRRALLTPGWWDCRLQVGQRACCDCQQSTEASQAPAHPGVASQALHSQPLRLCQVAQACALRCHFAVRGPHVCTCCPHLLCV